MSDWNIPKNADELFETGPTEYHIRDIDYPGDNIYGMHLFIDHVDIPKEMIEEDYGTQIVIFDGKKRLVIDSGGLGDFHLHGFTVSNFEVEK